MTDPLNNALPLTEQAPQDTAAWPEPAPDSETAGEEIAPPEAAQEPPTASLPRELAPREGAAIHPTAAVTPPFLGAAGVAPALPVSEFSKPRLRVEYSRPDGAVELSLWLVAAATVTKAPRQEAEAATLDLRQRIRDTIRASPEYQAWRSARDRLEAVERQRQTLTERADQAQKELQDALEGAEAEGLADTLAGLSKREVVAKEGRALLDKAIPALRQQLAQRALAAENAASVIAGRLNREAVEKHRGDLQGVIDRLAEAGLLAALVKAGLFSEKLSGLWTTSLVPQLCKELGIGVSTVPGTLLPAPPWARHGLQPGPLPPPTIAPERNPS